MTLVRLLFISIVFAAAGCSSSGGDDDSDGGGSVSTNRLDVDADNKNDAADGSRRGARKAINNSNAPTGAVIATDGLIQELAATAHAVTLLGNAPVGADQDVSATVCPQGGSAVVTIPDNPPSSGPVTSTFAYIDCMRTSGGITYTINGSGEFTFNQDTGDSEFSYDMTITDGSQTYEVSATLVCTDNGTNCTYSDSFSENGVNYQTTNVTVTGNNSSGYSVNATVFIGDLGFVEIVGTGLTICSNGNIGSGSIDVIDSNSNVVLNVTFPDCDTMVVTFMGVSDTISQ